jgi:hypothetical protein
LGGEPGVCQADTRGNALGHVPGALPTPRVTDRLYEEIVDRYPSTTFAEDAASAIGILRKEGKTQTDANAESS